MAISLASSSRFGSYLQNNNDDASSVAPSQINRDSGGVESTDDFVDRASQLGSPVDSDLRSENRVGTDLTPYKKFHTNRFGAKDIESRDSYFYGVKEDNPLMRSAATNRLRVDPEDSLVYDEPDAASGRMSQNLDMQMQAVMKNRVGR